jgi:hypothetical protein
MVTIRQPKPGDDRVPVVSLSIVVAIGLASGLGLAHAAMGELPPPGYVEDEGAVAVSDDDVSYGTPPVEVPAAGGHDEPSDGAAAPDSTAPADEAPPESTPAPSVEVSAPPAAEATPSAAPPTTAAAPLDAPTPTGPRPGTHVRRGRVAYLRCDGAPQQAGPFPCPRDEAFEAFVWNAIDTLETCSTAVSPGQADLVVDFEREESAAPSILTRDTFRDDVQRADAAAIVTCLTPILTTATSTIPGERLRVGFRFEVD